jgi:hypothetical protein
MGIRIYRNELSSGEVSEDKHQVASYQPLLEAVASGDRTATEAAVTTLVYSHTHIVRLRVRKGDTVLADVGGPYIIAPVSGTLRLHGRTVGRYVLSVQDDVGYVKLVHRFLGLPLVVRRGSQSVPIGGVVKPGPTTIPTHGPVSYRGVNYQAFSFDAMAFPAGTLRISLLVPVSRSLRLSTCTEIQVVERGKVAERLARRFNLTAATFSSFIRATQPLTDGLIFIRSGSHQYAGGADPGPRQLPQQGTVNYRGINYAVFSFAARSSVGSVRIYQLVRA